MDFEIVSDISTIEPIAVGKECGTEFACESCMVAIAGES